eukprot:TRINITY_DN351_c1_g1_i2.p1 TRINITY_DN351_c1_g1~~TRINITY_DN351_c1_g1_i2.p1  ORF type:complete len:626 (+),score=165.83 TRINITY_DN351_c1_g1_i2:54-1931(+)
MRRIKRLLRQCVKSATRPTDTREERQVKATFLTINISAIALCVVNGALSTPQADGWVYVTAILLFVSSHAAAFVGASTELVKPYVLLCTLLGIALDFTAHMDLHRRWTVLILIGDMTLLLTDCTKCTTMVVCMSGVWLAFFALDVSVTMLYADAREWSFFDYGEVQVCSCPSPPCAVSVFRAVSDSANHMFVFLLDFLLTQSFAARARYQLARVGASVDVAGLVAMHLSRYEVAEAQSVVEGDRGVELPTDLRLAFRRLLLNLEQYRPYLPMACFSGEAESEFATTEAERSTALQSMTSFVGRPRERTNSLPVARVNTTGTGTSSSGSSEAGTIPLVASVDRLDRNVRREPKSRAVTLLALNYKGFLGSPNAGDGQVCAWIDDAVVRFENAVLRYQGVVDLLSVDHYFASFNSARSCASHRLNGLRSGWDATFEQCGGLLPTAALTSGTAFCGDFGSSSHLRQMSIGPVASRLLMMERIAAVWGARLLMDNSVHERSVAAFYCRICAYVALPAKISGGGRVPVWEAMQRSEVERAGEWMYELTGLQAEDPWGNVNAAMERWAAGDNSAALQLAQTAAGADRCERACEVAAYLARRISAGEQAMQVYREGLPVSAYREAELTAQSC